MNLTDYLVVAVPNRHTQDRADVEPRKLICLMQT